MQARIQDYMLEDTLRRRTFIIICFAFCSFNLFFKYEARGGGVNPHLLWRHIINKEGTTVSSFFFKSEIDEKVKLR
jgi:hypothetical protein